jgi:hypothetical protein
MDAGFHLVRGSDRGEEIAALASSLRDAGRTRRVGLQGVLASLDRTGSVVRVPGGAVSWGFRWDEEDRRDARWWPQGVSTSGDAGAGQPAPVVCASWYAKAVAGEHHGSRVSFVDLTGRDRPRYRHVLLVEGTRDGDGRPRLRPWKVHAGGIVWHGGHLYVAGTARGIGTFRLDDVLRLEEPFLGHRFVLPVRFTYDAVADTGRERMRYSFLSLDRSGEEPRLVAGEYARRGRSRRLVDFAVDPATSLLRVSAEGHARPLSLPTDGAERMQGAVKVRDTWYVAASAGRFLRGTLYVGRPGRLRRHRWLLPVGVEDLAYWPERDEVWSLSEYPGRRYVFAMDRARLHRSWRRCLRRW